MRILYVTTTFPVYSETFLQREARAMLASGVEMRIVSLHRGEAAFEGHPVERFSKVRLLNLVWKLPYLLFADGAGLSRVFGSFFSSKPTGWLNFWENLLGAGAALILEEETRRWKPDTVHAVWASAPAAFALTLKNLRGQRFSMGAHAYDVFEHGGDWLLAEKAAAAELIHTSTESAATRLRSLVSESKIRVIRRGLNEFPECKPLRSDRSRLRIVCIGRLVEKKGFPLQVEIYRLIKAAGIAFEARILGDGPLRGWIEKRLQELGLSEQVKLLGRVSQAEALEQLQWADALFHTGVVAKSGDRDGLPNVIPEAMASGAIVVGSPVSGVVEAIEDGRTGLICEPWAPEQWVAACHRLQESDELCERLRRAAREWVEENFSADRNTGRLLAELKAVLGK